MRRRDEQQFGSDSFLDVLANLVGVLVVLIVIAGLRVSRAPQVVAVPMLPDGDEIAVVTKEAEVTIPAVAEPEAAPLAVELPVPEKSPPEPAFRSPQLVFPSRPVFAEPPPKPLPPLPPPQVPQTLLVRAESLAREMESVQRSDAALRKLQQDLEAREAVLTGQLRDAETESSRLTSRVKVDRQTLLALKAELEETSRQLARVRGHVEEAEREPAPKTLEHRVTPLGRLVNGKEIHFRLAGNRIAHVPVDDLAARLSSQVQRQKSTLLQTPSFEGVVGPVDGFQMRYLLERMPLSIAEEMQHGGRVIRMSVTQWTLEPMPDLPSESVDEALRRDSRFYNSLLSAGATTTLTLWVYPDSFEACAALKEFAYRHGYEVAARPLPAGVPISGSPQGTKSIAQ